MYRMYYVTSKHAYCNWTKFTEPLSFWLPNKIGSKILSLKFVSSVPSQFTFHAMIWGYFDQLNVPLKVMPPPWASGS